MKKFEKDLKYLITASSKTGKLMLSDTSLNPNDLKNLKAQGIITTRFFYDQDYSIEITDKGLTYFNDKKDYLKNKFIWNICTPIAVSIVTTLLTLWIKSLFK